MEVITYKNWETYFQNELGESYPAQEIKSLYTIAVQHFTGWSSAQYQVNKENEISAKGISFLKGTLSELKQGKPIQYILKETFFYGLKIAVDENVLIPRPETEELVDWMLKEMKNNAKILDVGTGSGCIPIALKKNRQDLRVIGIDVYEQALHVARGNAQHNAVDIEFVNLDILSDELGNLAKHKFEVIVSNPPYVRRSESITCIAM